MYTCFHPSNMLSIRIPPSPAPSLLPPTLPQYIPAAASPWGLLKCKWHSLLWAFQSLLASPVVSGFFTLSPTLPFKVHLLPLLNIPQTLSLTQRSLASFPLCYCFCQKCLPLPIFILSTLIRLISTQPLSSSACHLPSAVFSVHPIALSSHVPPRLPSRLCLYQVVTLLVKAACLAIQPGSFADGKALGWWGSYWVPRTRHPTWHRASTQKVFLEF